MRLFRRRKMSWQGRLFSLAGILFGLIQSERMAPVLSALKLNFRGIRERLTGIIERGSSGSEENGATGEDRD